jgi:manganese/iron transport system permease protein
MPLVEPFQFEFMQRALAEVALMGVVCGLTGGLVLLRGLTYTGESISHMLLPGGAIAVTIGASAVGGAIVAGLVAAAAIAWVLRHPRVDGDSAIGVAVAGTFSAGVIVLSARGAERDLDSLLFGSVLSVEPLDLWLGLGAMAGVAALTLGFARGLVLVAFDRPFAAASRLRPALLDLLLLASVALALAVALRGLGTLLVLALFVAPAATARIVARSPWSLLWLGPALAVLAGVAGLEISYHADVAAGPAIALVALLGFVVTATIRGWSLRPRAIQEGER